MRVALATSNDWPDLTSDDRTLLRPLTERGLAAEPVVWSDPNYPWQDCDAVVIRSCWDYHLRSQEFLRWTDQLITDPLEVGKHKPREFDDVVVHGFTFAGARG